MNEKQLYCSDEGDVKDNYLMNINRLCVIAFLDSIENLYIVLLMKTESEIMRVVVNELLKREYLFVLQRTFEIIRG